MWIGRVTLISGCLLWAPAVTAGQFPIPPVDRPGDTRPQLPPIEDASPATLTTPAGAAEPRPRPRLSTAPRMTVTAYRVTGNTVFADAELAGVTAKWVRADIATEDLLEARDALTRYYIAHGYINSGATLPDQEVKDGVVELAVTEGRLTRVDVLGTKWFRRHYFERRLWLGDAPLNVNDLEIRLQVLQQAQRGRRLDAALGPGLQRGESDLALTVQERLPVTTRFEYSNYQSPSIGGQRGQASVDYESVTGNADHLSASYGKTRGLADVDVSYQYPLTAHDTTLRVRYSDGNSVVIEEPFSAVDIESRSRTYSVSVEQPFRKSPAGAWTVGVSGEMRESETLLLGRGFTFSEGAVNGRARVSVIRLSQSWTRRNRTQVLAMRSQVSVGIDAFGATIHSTPIQDGSGRTRRLADGQFVSALGQFQWARRLGWFNGTEVVGRVDTQISRDPLLSIEQFAIGGHASVRGYRENQMVRDSGSVASLEARLPLFTNTRGRPLLRIGPLVDAGTGWNRNRTTPDPRLLASAGVALQVNLFRDRVALQGAWAQALRRVDTHGDLQDHGVHFSVSVIPW